MAGLTAGMQSPMSLLASDGKIDAGMQSPMSLLASDGKIDAGMQSPMSLLASDGRIDRRIAILVWTGGGGEALSPVQS